MAAAAHLSVSDVSPRLLRVHSASSCPVCCFALQNHPAVALKMVEEALRAVPGNGQFLDTRGWAYFQMGRLKEAEADITAALEKLPGEPVILEHVGDIYWATGRNKESLWLWRQSLELNPEDRDSRRIKEKLIQREPRGHDHNP